MIKVKAIGGVFFKCEDTKSLAHWYEKHLGFDISEHGFSMFKPREMPAGGFTLWTPFKADTDYFGDGPQQFMFNLIVDDVVGALAQVKEGGAEIVGEVDDTDYGVFGWFIDPAGFKVELWNPASPRAKTKPD